ncbi:hypothetical protein A4X13_0g6163 [Tilletia indica]|uniref:Uncharacterized protein n=1 Tax=Tilletia indica TaxID=43049 RepID=A0A177THJ3_9BASI|nr:hypothetical protein A4X13_0g6163 [Tilletia indica]
MSSSSRIYFSTFDITPQVFLQTPHAIALVNLKPLIPGHVLVIPRRTSAVRLKDLKGEEVREVFEVVQRVGGVVEDVFGGEGLTVSVQDGEVAGQSVPHLHVHILPRRKDDFTPNDALYPLLEKFGFDLAELHRNKVEGGPDDEARKPRTAEQMRAEAEWLAGFFRGEG